MKEIDLTLAHAVSIIILVLVGIYVFITDYYKKDEQIKQLKQSNIEIQQECEVYRNRCLELENIIEGTGLVVDNCECR